MIHHPEHIDGSALAYSDRHQNAEFIDTYSSCTEPLLQISRSLVSEKVDSDQVDGQAKDQ